MPSDAAQAGGQDCAARDAEESQQACDERRTPSDDETTHADETEGQTLEECKRELKEGEEKEQEEGLRHEDGEEVRKGDLLPSLEDSGETNIEDIGALHHGPEPQACGLRRRNRPE